MKLVKCTDCQNAGNNEKGKFICFQLKSNFWFKEVLNTNPDCEFFEPLTDIGERWELTYPVELLNK